MPHLHLTSWEVICTCMCLFLRHFPLPDPLPAPFTRARSCSGFLPVRIKLFFASLGRNLFEPDPETGSKCRRERKDLETKTARHEVNRDANHQRRAITQVISRDPVSHQSDRCATGSSTPQFYAQVWLTQTARRNKTGTFALMTPNPSEF